jgi:hypothetical protein
MAKTGAELLADPYDLVFFVNYNGNQKSKDYQRAWMPLVEAGSRIVVLADNPESSNEALACLTRVSFGSDRTGECGTPRPDALRHPDPLVAAAAAIPGASSIDLTPYYCTTDRCPSIIGNVIVYRDTNHITATFAKTLARPIENGLQRALGVPAAGPR